MVDIKLTVPVEPEMQEYYKKIADRVKEQIEKAEKARATGRDVTIEVESTPAVDLADRTEKIIGPVGIAKRFREVYKEQKGDRNKAIFQIFKEIIEEKWIEIPDREKRLEQALKTALVLVTEGVVVAPLDGVPNVKISKNPDGSEYVDVFYAGPIRAAGGSAQVFPLILGDYARKLLSLDRYKPTEAEVERYIEENMLYDELITRQYKLSSEEIKKIVIGCPVCINGEPTEEKEVSNYRDLDRLPTNRIRGGMCLVMSEGVAMKAMKILTYAKMLGLDWSWLEEIIQVSKKQDSEKSEYEPDSKYLGRIAAGRPIFCYPSRIGGFRLRYGRCRNSGVGGKGMHPATMILLDEFVAVGTQLKVEKPGKSAGIFPCDSIEGPIVKLLDGSVRKVSSVEEANEVKNQVDKILFLGDFLVSFGDFRHTAHPLLKPGYCEEWYALELQELMKNDVKAEGVDLRNVIKNPGEVDCFTAMEISMQLNMSLHPHYTYYYNALAGKELLELIDFAKKARTEFEENKIIAAEFENNEKCKEYLEKIGIPHFVEGESIRIGKEHAYPFMKTLGALNPSKKRKLDPGKDVHEILSDISGIRIRDKGGTFIGGRMGRPETAKPRKMIGNPHVLFPIGLYGGNIRSINKAMAYEGKGNERGLIEVELGLFKCGKCGAIIPGHYCMECNKFSQKIYKCSECGTSSTEIYCKRCKKEMRQFSKLKINIKDMMEQAADRLGVGIPEIVKGVKGLINEGKITEPLEKGILRAVHDLHVFRDGTIRYEMLNAPLTHFTPKEIGLKVEKAKELGYVKDLNGKPLENEEQILELFPQDVVINQDAGDFFVKVSRYVDDLFTKMYGLNAYHKLQNRNQLIGELLVSLAPHTSAAVVGRVIGYTKGRVNFAHPYFHLAKRRNCDGEQDSFMLLTDNLLNFSNSYLASTRGGRMDAPVVFTVTINPNEIDDEVYDMEVCRGYGIEFYKNAEKMGKPEVESVKRVAHKLGSKSVYRGIHYTHPTTTMDAGPKKSRYVQLQSMEDKIKSQAKIQSKIMAVDSKSALERVIVSHFLPDIIGNARSFSRQNFRCTKCNTVYRRMPLKGKCNKCTDGNIILTIAEGSVKKYLKITKEIVETYSLDPYLKQRLQLIEQEVNSMFSREKASQKDLFAYV